MTTPAQPAGPAPQGPPTRSGRSELARLWVKALDDTAYVPAARQDVERVLRALLDDLVDILRAESFSSAPAREVGVALVAAQFSSEQSVSRTVELLGAALPAQPELHGVDRLSGKVIALLGALAAGFAAALRARTLDQQEQVKQALLQANQDAERELRVSEAKFREIYTSSAAGIAISDLDGTLVPNQQYFVSTLERALGQGGRVTVCTIDLDSFAVINDAFGRQAGDKVLQWVATRLQSVVAGQDATVARFGADRFAILIENSPSTPDVAALAAEINAALGEPVYFDNHGISVSCGIGITSRDSGGIEPADLLRAAEAALHRVKRSSKRQWALYDPDHDTEHRARCRLAAVMPRAWESGEVSLEYQPMVRLRDGSVAAVQALLRWDHPQQGPLSHQECLTLAARTGLALPLGQWMLHHAAGQFTAWRKQRAETGEPGPTLQIDLVPQHAHDPDLVTTVSCALDSAGLTADRLRIGMPVSALDTEQDEAADNLQVLSELGVGLAMLGCSGAGAVAHLEDLPIHAVELAPHLVQRIADRGTDCTVARAVPPLLHLMQSCGAQVIVRDIRTTHQATWWHRAGADIAQGPYFAPPGPL